MFDLNDNELTRKEVLSQNTTEYNNIGFNVNSTRLFPNNFNLTTETLFDKSLSISHINVRSLFCSGTV